MLTDLLLVKVRLPLRLRLDVLRAVAIHGEQGHSGAALGVNRTNFLF